MGRVAVIDLGTNSSRLLVAEVEDGRLTELVRRTEVTRLGEGVDSSGRLAEDAMERVFATLAEYREQIDQHRADKIVAVATSAVRDAANGDYFREQLNERFGIQAKTISGDQEALLTFKGATADLPEADTELTMVNDIGGGSTEFVVGRAGHWPDFHVSTKLGSVRHTERFLSNDDPPSAEQLARAREEIATIIEEGVPAEVRAKATRGIAVAGTATSLAAIDQCLDPYDPERVHGYELTREATKEILETLRAQTTEERAQTPGLLPARAPTIVAGAAVLAEIYAAFDLSTLTVSEHDILHGAALEAAESPAD
ncbi:MAG: Ppx/GppA family phosphatase [Thermoleophilaceae bacterium]|nr:Ppx/GppA family phosphatase [Thermoleophilaceae bacterium]